MFVLERHDEQATLRRGGQVVWTVANFDPSSERPIRGVDLEDRAAPIARDVDESRPRTSSGLGPGGRADGAAVGVRWLVPTRPAHIIERQWALVPRRHAEPARYAEATRVDRDDLLAVHAGRVMTVTGRVEPAAVRHDARGRPCDLDHLGCVHDRDARRHAIAMKVEVDREEEPAVR